MKGVAHRPSPTASRPLSAPPAVARPPPPRPPEFDPEVVPRLIRRGQCGRTVNCTPADIRVFTAIGAPACCGLPMNLPVSLPARVTPPPSARRRPARAGIGIEVRRFGQARGPELADALVDLSADGLGIRLEVQMVLGDRVDITLRPPGAARPISRVGQVRWCRPDAGGRYLAGISLVHPLSPVELQALIR